MPGLEDGLPHRRAGEQLHRSPGVSAGEVHEAGGTRRLDGCGCRGVGAGTHPQLTDLDIDGREPTPCGSDGPLRLCADGCADHVRGPSGRRLGDHGVLLRVARLELGAPDQGERARHGAGRTGRTVSAPRLPTLTRA
jgi:hypothetical protein